MPIVPHPINSYSNQFIMQDRPASSSNFAMNPIELSNTMSGEDRLLTWAITSSHTSDASLSSTSQQEENDEGVIEPSWENVSEVRSCVITPTIPEEVEERSSRSRQRQRRPFNSRLDYTFSPRGPIGGMSMEPPQFPDLDYISLSSPLRERSTRMLPLRPRSPSSEPSTSLF